MPVKAAKDWSSLHKHIAVPKLPAGGLPLQGVKMPSRRHSWHAEGERLKARQHDDIESQIPRSDSAGTSRPSSVLARLQGPITLTSVALLWGTYGPTLRLLYDLPGPPHPAALTTARSIIQAACLYGTTSFLTSTGSHKVERQSDQGSTALQAGLEMGFWNFMATSLQAVGLEHTTAVRSGFIIQVTAILTPLLATIAGEQPTRNMWIGCCIALVSTVLITLDSNSISHSGSPLMAISPGDAAVFGAAFFYSVTTVRLSHYAQRLPAISVASAKSNALTGFALLWLGGLAVQKGLEGGSVGDFWQGIAEPQAWLLVLWAALGPGATAAFLQTSGQSKASSSQAQIFYSSTPIWSAVIAMMVLKEENMGYLGWLGGLGILLAGITASR